MCSSVDQELAGMGKPVPCAPSVHPHCRPLAHSLDPSFRQLSSPPASSPAVLSPYSQRDGTGPLIRWGQSWLRKLRGSALTVRDTPSPSAWPSPSSTAQLYYQFYCPCALARLTSPSEARLQPLPSQDFLKSPHRGSPLPSPPHPPDPTHPSEATSS